MGAKGGLNPEVMLAAINAGNGRNSATESKFPAAVLTRSFDYGAEMHILMKDIDLAVAQGEELGVPMWVCEAARLVFKHAMHKGAAKEDLTAIVKYIERDAGFEMPKTRSCSLYHSTEPFGVIDFGSRGIWSSDGTLRLFRPRAWSSREKSK